MVLCSDSSTGVNAGAAKLRYCLPRCFCFPPPSALSEPIATQVRAPIRTRQRAIRARLAMARAYARPGSGSRSAARRHPVGVEDGVDVAQPGDALLELAVVADLDHEAVLHHRVLRRAIGLEDVDPGLGEGLGEVLEQPGAVPAVDLELDAIGGAVVPSP